MAAKGKIVTVESEGKEAIGAEGLPAATFTDGKWCGAAAVVKDEGLMVVIKVGLDGFEELVGEIAIFGEVLAILEVDDLSVDFCRGGFGLLTEGDEGIVGFGKVIISDERSGGAEKVGDPQLASDKTGETDGGIFGGIFLEIGGFVGFVDDDETKVFDGGKKGGTGADDDKGRFCLEDVLPLEVAFGLGESGVEEDNLVWEVLLKDGDKLRSEGDLGDEQDSGSLLF